MLSHGRGDALFVLHQKKEHEGRIECQFDSFCKKVLRNEARKYYRDLKKRRRREISLDELTICPCPFLQWEMDVFSGHVFHALDTPIIIYHEKLAEELINMEEKYRSIILMAYCFEMSDQKISNELNIARRTGTRYRNKMLKLLRKQLEDQKGHEPL